MITSPNMRRFKETIGYTFKNKRKKRLKGNLKLRKNANLIKKKVYLF